MSKRRRIGSWFRARFGSLVIGLAFAASGCTASLKSAATVGGQGARLSERVPSTKTDVICDLGAALLPTSDRATCEKWNQQAESRRAALEVLASYGAALQELAELEDPDTAGRVDGMFDALEAAALTSETDLSDDQKGALREAITGLTGFVSKSHRVSVVTKAVEKADAPIQVLVHKLVAIMQARDAYLQVLDRAFDDLLAAPPSSGSDARFVECRERPTASGGSGPCPYEAMVLVNATDRVSLALARDLVRSATQDNEKTIRDLLAFAKLHGKLRREIGRLDGEDAELAGELLQELRNVYAVVQAAPPKEQAPKGDEQ